MAKEIVLAVAIAIVFLAMVAKTRRWLKVDGRGRRERQMAKALGANVGLKVTELDAMFPPKTVYEHRRLVKFTFHIPANYIGVHPGGSAARTAAEVALRATIHGWMGHVAVEWVHALPKGSFGTVTLSRAEVPKPIPEFVDAEDLR